MKALVTGGGGFLGSAIAKQLIARGDSVRSYSRQRYDALDSLGVEQIPGDLADAEALSAAAAGCDVVFHVAAKAGVWGSFEDYFAVNVVGAENALAAARANGIGKLVYTSTPSVAQAGRDIEGGDESLPYAEHFETAYPETKALAERLVLEANGDELATVALRPHLIWGPGDNHLAPRIIARAASLRRIGAADKKVDATYIDNAAAAHLAAADRLSVGAACAGKAYFIANGEPIVVWDLLDRILAAAGKPPIRKRSSFALAYLAATMLEATHKLLRRPGEPQLTRFVVRQLSTAHWFDLTAARRDLGYEPKVSMDEGFRRLAEWLKQPRTADA